MWSDDYETDPKVIQFIIFTENYCIIDFTVILNCNGHFNGQNTMNL